MKVLLSFLFSCIASNAYASGVNSPALQSVESLEQMQSVEQFLGMGHDHRRPYPPHDRPPHYRPPRPRPPREYICYTENARRVTFWARDYSPRFAQRIATEQCYRYSRYCYELGCEVYRY